MTVPDTADPATHFVCFARGDSMNLEMGSAFDPDDRRRWANSTGLRAAPWQVCERLSIGSANSLVECRAFGIP